MPCTPRSPPRPEGRGFPRKLMTDKFVSQREFAKHIGRSHVWVNRLVKNGRLPSDDKGYIPLNAGLEAYRLAQRPDDDVRRAVAAEQRAAYKAKAGKPAHEPEPTVQESEPMPDVSSIPASAAGMSVARINEAFNRARLAEKTYQAKLRELEYKEASGQLIPVGDVEADAARTGAEVRERLMTVAPRVAGLCEGKTAREIERIIREAVNEALEALQRARFGKK